MSNLDPIQGGRDAERAGSAVNSAAADAEAAATLDDPLGLDSVFAEIEQHRPAELERPALGIDRGRAHDGADDGRGNSAANEHLQDDFGIELADHLDIVDIATLVPHDDFASPFDSDDAIDDALDDALALRSDDADDRGFADDLPSVTFDDG